MRNTQSYYRPTDLLNTSKAGLFDSYDSYNGMQENFKQAK